MTDVVVHVELAPLDKPAVMEHVLVKQVVLDDNVVMMDAVMNHAGNVPLPKPVKTVFVLELLSLNAPEEFAETTELEDPVEPVPLDRDVAQDNVNATMIVMKETVGMQLNLMEVTLPLAHKDPVEPVLLDLPANPTEDALR